MTLPRKKAIHGNGAKAITPDLHNTPLIQKVTVPDVSAEAKLFNMYLTEKALKEEAYDIIYHLRAANSKAKSARQAYNQIKRLIGLPISHAEKE